MVDLGYVLYKLGNDASNQIEASRLGTNPDLLAYWKHMDGGRAR